MLVWNSKLSKNFPKVASGVTFYIPRRSYDKSTKNMGPARRRQNRDTVLPDKNRVMYSDLLLFEIFDNVTTPA
jgi:hypothetical protein